MAPVIDHRVAPTLDPFHTSDRSQSKRRTEAFGAAFARRSSEWIGNNIYGHLFNLSATILEDAFELDSGFRK
ncbi:MAG TPA: hypothetical protein DCL17_03940 [Dehalococcoidia bacterium]|nr:hypothetical protein [Dehalococcoidia bacterium]